MVQNSKKYTFVGYVVFVEPKVAQYLIDLYKLDFGSFELQIKKVESNLQGGSEENREICDEVLNNK